MIVVASGPPPRDAPRLANEKHNQVRPAPLETVDFRTEDPVHADEHKRQNPLHPGARRMALNPEVQMRGEIVIVLFNLI